MSKRRKICVIITTRGNYGKMKSVIEAIQRYDNLELRLVVGGGALLEKYGKIAESFELDGIPINHRIHFIVEGENPITMSKSAGLAVIEFSNIFETMRPDLVTVIADRYESLAIAMAASYMNIPLAHIEGGEVSGSIDESIGHAITKMAHIHFPATQEAAERIKKLGEPAESIYTVGATSLDVIAQLNLEDLKVPFEQQKNKGVGPIVDLSQGYLLVIQHPVTTEYENSLSQINETVNAIDSLKMNTIWIWPNMDAGSDIVSKGIRLFREHKKPEYVHFFKSLPIESFAVLLNNSSCVVGNSSCGIREAAFLGVPSVNIGSRQSGRQRGKNVVDVPYDSENINNAIKQKIEHGRYEPDFLYGDGKAGEKIADCLSKHKFVLQKKITY